jgi:hypothetical protein
MSNHPEGSTRNVGEQMAALAAEFVEAAKAAGITLDYLPRTLPIAEKMTKSSPAEAARMAAYLGEVVRRETRGFWFESEGVTPMVYCGIEPYVDPKSVVDSLLSTGRVAVGATTVESAKAYCETISRLQRQWLDGALLGTYESVAALRTSMAADAKTAGIALALAQNAVLTAKLDWSEDLAVGKESLDAVERMLGAMHTLKNQNTVTSEQIESLCKMMGVFVGEIIRRHYGGLWRVAENGDLELPYPGTTIHPIARARKRVMDGPSDNIRMYYASLPKIIAS